MNTRETAYRFELDLLKGLAIMAVVLYHAGWCKSGYLGVDVFLVISGYLTVPKVVQAVGEGRFRYWAFLERRVFRLLPMVLVVCAVSLAVGYWAMLPGDYRYLSEEAMAASVFMGNVLQAVTTQNYWAAIYHKVLMHTWYLGVLMQFFVVFPLLMMLFRRRMRTVLVVLSVVSLVLYLLPVDTIGDKYYLLPYRFFEIALGGLVALGWQGDVDARPRRSDTTSLVSSVCLLAMIFFGASTLGERAMPYNLVGGTNTIRESFLPREALVLLTATFTLLMLVSPQGVMEGVARRSRVIAPLGRMSLSLFLWHQPLFAFWRYLVADELSPVALIGLTAVAVALSLLTYYNIERRLKVCRGSRWGLLLAFLCVNAFALWVYGQGGAVRDVPELDIRKGEADAKAFERYTDRIYEYDREFDEADTVSVRILVVGNSFARDFANILLESDSLLASTALTASTTPSASSASPASSRFQLSYHYGISDCPLSRIRACDRLYFFGWKHDVPAVVWQNLEPGAEAWGIGTKNHGTSNGIFYRHRNGLFDTHRSGLFNSQSNDSVYFAQRVVIHPDYLAVNRRLREEWQSRYVDLLALTLRTDGTVPVFTSDRHFITYDGMHLTPSGVRYYARLLANKE